MKSNILELETQSEEQVQGSHISFSRLRFAIISHLVCRDRIHWLIFKREFHYNKRAELFWVQSWDVQDARPNVLSITVIKVLKAWLYIHLLLQRGWQMPITWFPPLWSGWKPDKDSNWNIFYLKTHLQTCKDHQIT